MPNLDMEEFPNVARHLLVPVRADGGFEPGLAVDGSNPKPEDYEGGEVVALDLTLNDDLLRRGYLRDLVRQVQDLRKTSGLDVSDRIVLHVVGVDDLAEGFDLVAREVLATAVLSTPSTGDGEVLSFDDEREGARAWVVKAD